MTFKETKKALLFLLLALYFSFAYATTSMGGCVKGDCTNGQGTFTYPGGAVYVGQWESDKFNGQGTFTYSDGSVYVGQWENSQRNGQGTFTRPSGSKYQGQWENDKFNGQGIYIYPDGSEYEGRWKNNMRNGTGIYTSSSGSKYQGQWKNGKLIGQGILITSDGKKFVGRFNKDGNLVGAYMPLADAHARAEAEAQKKAEIAAKRKADALAKAKADAHARAEVEAQKKAEIAANRKADAVAKAKADAHARAEAEAQKKAEIAANRKADAVAKAKVDAHARAEVEAQKKAEIEAKRKVDAVGMVDAQARAKAEAETMTAAKVMTTDETEKKARVKEKTKAKAAPGKKTFIAPNGMKFVYISPGTFTMGSPEAESGRYENELEHQVTLTQGIYMQITEVTQGQWTTLMGNNPAFFNGCGVDCPVEQVSWDDAQQFIWRLNQLEGANKYRLPTEAEWEYACRAGSTTAFASGAITTLACDNDANLNDVAWFCNNSAKTIHPVAQKKANAWGLYDMHGNVSELCQDWYGAYPPDQISDPKGPASGIDHTVRGGGWDSHARHCRSACRGAVSSGQKIYDVGIRLVRMP